MTEPSGLASAITEILERYPEGKLRPALLAMLEQHGRNQRRRAEVLKHEDLRDRLTRELGYTRATNWNGYIPPDTVNEFSNDELCQVRTTDRQFREIVRYNQLGHYGIGETMNDSLARRVLLEVEAVALERRNAGTV